MTAPVAHPESDRPGERTAQTGDAQGDEDGIAPDAGSYVTSWDSLRRHRVPAWFRDAKLGIMVTWAPSSVPAWAPIESDLASMLRDQGDEYYFTNNPYAEWYGNTIRIPGSPSRRHHEETFGPDFAYERFGPMFAATADRWEPGGWADAFAASGARYVVLVSKHHDGYLLWPSRHRNPRMPGYHTDGDLVGLAGDALRARGLRFGIYYSGGLDWTFNQTAVRDIPSQLASIVQDPDYARLADAHWLELIDRYRPDILWGDIGYPRAGDLERVFAHYYNTVADGVINDRFAQDLPATVDMREMLLSPTNLHYDFVTPEYTSFASPRDTAWESVRGLGLSFGYNANETPDTHLEFDELVHLLATVVSRNGNLLLGVGPMADGTIPPIQRERLAQLGGWLAINGDAIFGTRPWVVADGATREGIPVRFTRRGSDLYVILLADVDAGTVSLTGVCPAPGAELVALDAPDRPCRWAFEGDVLTMHLPAPPASSPARVIRIQGAPRPWFPA